MKLRIVTLFDKINRTVTLTVCLNEKKSLLLNWLTFCFLLEVQTQSLFSRDKEAFWTSRPRVGRIIEYGPKNDTQSLPAEYLRQIIWTTENPRA